MHLNLFVTNNRYFSRYGFIGGHIEHVRGTIEGFLLNGFSVTLHTSSDIENIQEQFFAKNNEVSIQPFGTKGRALSHYVRLFIRLMKCVVSTKPAITYVRYSASSIPIIVCALLLRQLFSRQNRFILEVNSFISNYYPALSFMDRCLAGFKFDMVLVSRDLKAHWELLSKKPSKVTTHIVPNGVMQEKLFRLKTGYSDFDGIAYIGVLKPGYGIDEMLKSFIACSSAASKRMFIIGDGPERARLIREYNHKNVFFLGGKWGDDLKKFVENKKVVLIYPGIDKFTFQSPVKLYDYLSFGAPIICCQQKNAQELLNGFKAHVICDVNSPSALARAINEIEDMGSDLDLQVQFNQLRANKLFGWSQRIKVLLAGMKT